MGLIDASRGRGVWRREQPELLLPQHPDRELAERGGGGGVDDEAVGDDALQAKLLLHLLQSDGVGRGGALVEEGHELAVLADEADLVAEAVDLGEDVAPAVSGREDEVLLAGELEHLAEIAGGGGEVEGSHRVHFPVGAVTPASRWLPAAAGTAALRAARQQVHAQRSIFRRPLQAVLWAGRADASYASGK